MPFLPLTRGLRTFMLSVDLGFILYWIITLANLLPAEWLYAHHDDPMMVAWNWSFMPLDLLISATGLGAVFAAKRADARWTLLAMLSLAATSASGMNAIAFWVLVGDFDMTWWLPNLVLLLGPWPFVWRLWSATAGRAALDHFMLLEPPQV